MPDEYKLQANPQVNWAGSPPIEEDKKIGAIENEIMNLLEVASFLEMNHHRLEKITNRMFGPHPFPEKESEGLDEKAPPSCTVTKLAEARRRLMQASSNITEQVQRLEEL